MTTSNFFSTLTSSRIVELNFFYSLTVQEHREEFHRTGAQFFLTGDWRSIEFLIVPVRAG